MRLRPAGRESFRDVRRPAPNVCLQGNSWSNENSDRADGNDDKYFENGANRGNRNRLQVQHGGNHERVRENQRLLIDHSVDSCGVTPPMGTLVPRASDNRLLIKDGARIIAGHAHPPIGDLVG